MKIARRITTLLIAALWLGGCSSGNAVPPSAVLTDSATSTNATRAAKGMGLLRLVIRIPHRKSRAHYISPSTQSMTIDLTGPTPLKTTIPLTPTSPGCTTSSAATTCVVALQLLPGDYTGTLSTYDSAVPAAGNLLSFGQNVPFSIVNGIVNDVGITLSGAPAQLRVKPNDSAHVVAPSVRSFGIYGLLAQTFSVVALDAGGNVIAGDGAPSFTVNVSGSLPVKVVSPTQSQPNQFSLQLQTPWAVGASGTLAVRAVFPTGTDGCAPNPTACTISFALQPRQLLAVASAFRNNEQIFDLTSGGARLVATVSGNDPKIVTFDANGNLFVGNGDTETVVKYAFATNTRLAQYRVGGKPSDLAILPDQSTLFVANGKRIVPVDLSTGKVGTGIRAGDVPIAEAVSADGSKLYAAGHTSSDVSIIDTATQSRIKTVGLPITCVPSSLALGSAYLFVACSLSSQIRQIDLATNKLHRGSVSSLAIPSSLAIDTNGLLYSANEATGSVAQFNTLPVPLARLGYASSGHLPVSVSIDGTNRAYVVNHLSSDVRILNSDRSSAGTISTNGLPTSAAIYP